MKMNNFKFGFSPVYVKALSKFMAKNDVRYYLNGFNIKPHPKGGVILTATNGHALVTIHDELGFSDAEYTMPLTKRFVSEAEKGRILPSQSILGDGNQMIITCISLSETEEFTLDESTGLYSEFANKISCKYPDLGNLFSGIDLCKTSSIGVNPELLGMIKHCTDSPRAPAAKIYFSGSTGSVVAVSGMKNQYFSVIMAMRVDDIDDPFVVPSHVKALIKLSNKRKFDEAKTKKLEEQAA
jgi:hypothetical protein